MPESNIYYDGPDKSYLHRAWREYYAPMKLSYNKLLEVVNRRVRKGKMPTP